GWGTASGLRRRRACAVLGVRLIASRSEVFAEHRTPNTRRKNSENCSLQKWPTEQDRLVEDLDGLAEQEVGQAGLAAVDPRPDLGPGPHLGDLDAPQVVLPELVREAGPYLDDVPILVLLHLGPVLGPGGGTPPVAGVRVL